MVAPHYLKRLLVTLALFALSAGGCSTTTRMKYAAVYGSGSRELVVATGSPGELGLVKVIAEKFSQGTNVRVAWRKAGSGKSLQLLHDKQVDAVMVHAPSAEKKAVGKGWAARRTLIGSNEFYIVGPTEDPAGIQTAKTVVEAYRRIARAREKFLSRSDNSGTHMKEMAIWNKAGIVPKGNWYVRTGGFMMPALMRANAEKAYFMTDSSTWVVGRKRTGNLRILFRGDPSLVNVYHALCQPAGRTPGAALAAGFVDFLASQNTQKIIGEYGKDRYGAALYRGARASRQFE